MIQTYYVPERFNTISASRPARLDAGHNIFQSDARKSMMQAARRGVHENAKPTEAFALYETLKKKEVKK